MGISLYYNAIRDNSITEQEDMLCRETAERYCLEYPFEEKAEDFCIYELNEETDLVFGGDVIFSGSVKLPDSDPEFMFDVAVYWLKCLTEITNILENCEWDVTFDDIDMVFDEDEGWRFPTDEEYE